jgi:TRAP-type mannitol/chloroaromatic compound transport system permease small subunit
MKKFIRVVGLINEWVGKIASVLLIPLTLITAYEVIMRYVFSKPTIWAWDLNIQIFAFLNLLGGGYTLLHSGHVNVDVIVGLLRPRKRAFVDLLTSFLFFLGVSVLMVGGWQVGWSSLEARETMSTIWAPPIYPMKLALPAGAFLVLIQGIAIFLQNLMIVLGGEGGN